MDQVLPGLPVIRAWLARGMSEKAFSLPSGRDRETATVFPRTRLGLHIPPTN